MHKKRQRLAKTALTTHAKNPLDVLYVILHPLTAVPGNSTRQVTIAKKLFKCNICPSAFARIDNLMLPKGSHVQEKSSMAMPDVIRSDE